MATGNLVTNQGKLICLNRTFNTIPSYTVVGWFKVGTGTNTPSEGDTGLQTPVIITGGSDLKLIATATVDEPTLTSTNECVLLTTDANGNYLTEFGLFNNDGTKKCFSRAVYIGITKTASVQVIFTEKDMVA